MGLALALLAVNLPALAIAVVAGLIAYVIIYYVSAWWARFTFQRTLEQIRKNPEKHKLMPDSLFVVEVSDTGVVCKRPDKKVESVTWDDLQSVEIINTDAGPYSPDVFWLLDGTNGGCAIPQGATGEKELLDKLHALPGFDNGAMIAAMTTFTNKRTTCWRRPAP